jgi:hypothetical protein
MSDFSIRSDSVDVEQIMRQIRARIRDKRGVDYTEQQIQELANAKLDKFLDSRGIRSNLIEQYRRHREESVPPTYEFEDTTLFDSDKPAVRFVRKLLQPILKLFFNYNALSRALHLQAGLNRYVFEREPLYYELLHNLVVELTRAGVEIKNMKMRVEALQSRLEFTERRARALEGVVQYKPEALRGLPRSDAPASGRGDEGTEPQGGVDPITGGESVRTRRRRRRRGRRGPGGPGGPEAATGQETAPDTYDDADAEDLSQRDSLGSDPTGSDPDRGSEPPAGTVPQGGTVPPPFDGHVPPGDDHSQ